MRVGRISRLLKLSHECLPVTDLLKSILIARVTAQEVEIIPKAFLIRWIRAETGFFPQRHTASVFHRGDHGDLAIPAPIRLDPEQVVTAAAPTGHHMLAPAG